MGLSGQVEIALVWSTDALNMSIIAILWNHVICQFMGIVSVVIYGHMVSVFIVIL